MPRRSRKDLKADDHPFINGWGIVSPGSTLLHAVPWPGELGEVVPALCGTTSAPANGWMDPEQRSYYCNPCTIELRKMYEEDDERLTPHDRQRHRDISRMS